MHFVSFFVISETMKKYALVRFHCDSSAELVPLKWYKNNKCWYPTDSPTTALMKPKLIKLEEPNENYELYDATVLYRTCEFFNTK